MHLFLHGCSAPALFEVGLGLVCLYNSFVLASENLSDGWEDIWTRDLSLGK